MLSSSIKKVNSTTNSVPISASLSISPSMTSSTKSTSSFCIDALLARQDRPVKSPLSTESLDLSSTPASPALSHDDARSSTSPLSSPNINGTLYSGARSTSSEQGNCMDLRTPPISPIWANRSSNIQMCSSLANVHSHPNHSHSAAAAAMSLFSSTPNHPLYAAMYGVSHGPHGISNGSAGPPSNIPLIHGSAFHSPFHDMKNHSGSSGLPIDWLARAGLLYHRSSGKNFCKVINER